MATRCCGFSVIISKSHTFLLKRITAEVFSPLTLMADFHGPCSLLGVCFSWQGQSPLPCFRELFNYKSSTLLLLPFLSLSFTGLCVTQPSPVKRTAPLVHPSPVSCPRIYYVQGGEAECGVFLEKGPPLEPQCQQMTVTYSRKATQKENDLTPQPRAHREWEKIKSKRSTAGGGWVEGGGGTIKIRMRRGKDGETQR